MYPQHPADDRHRLDARTSVFLLLITLCIAAYGHADLQLQIDELTGQLELESDNVELLLKRGDLQRRHQNWDLARADFRRVRELQPENRTVDWFEGRLEVQAGQPLAGIRYLKRFLINNPGHTIALQNRAEGYLLLNRHLLAAEDLQSVIRLSDKPAPSLYGANALALVAAGGDFYPAATNVVQEGLLLFPGEIRLTGIATDLYLAQSDTDAARVLIDQLPASIRKLQQWQTRTALLDCQSGDQSSAGLWFTHASEIAQSWGHDSGLLSEQWLTRLAREPIAENCRAAALEVLNSR